MSAVPRVPATPPPIESLAPSEPRPLWSVMIPVFNAGRYLPEALESVLRQAPASDVMQIAVVDDASTDIDVRTLVQQVGLGRLEYTRQAANVGSVANFNTCLSLARGRYVHLLHADDRVLPGYYAAMEELFTRFPDAGMSFSRCHHIDEAGKQIAASELLAKEPGRLEGWLEKIASRQRTQYAGVSVRREVYERLGGYFGVDYGEDWEMWVRIASQYPVAHTPELLAEYRIHGNSISSARFQTAQNLRDLAWVMKTIQSYLPLEMRKRAWDAATAHYARYGLMIADRLWRRNGNREAAMCQVREALKMHEDAEILQKVVDLYGEMLASAGEGQ